MTFRRGAALTTATTLGFADTADLGPTAGNGFYRGWPDDLASIQELGITDLRLTLDWARLQPKPGSLDPDWSERFEQILAAAAAIGLRTWATLHDGSIPKWFDNEGGFGDGEVFGRWWPRWVEAIADRFGDSVGGWVPFAELPADARGPWRDTWTILEGVHPVVASILAPGAGAAAAVDDVVERLDLLGLVLPTPWELDSADDDPSAAVADGWGQLIRDAADDARDAPVVVTGFEPNHHDSDTAGRIVTTLVGVLDEAIADGVTIEMCLLQPAIATASGTVGLLDAGRNATPLVDAFLPPR